jgi:hypothetical protein
MDFKAILEEGHSKKITTYIVTEVGNSSKKFAKLMQVFTDESALIIQRAAWPISYIGQQNPGLLIPYYPLFIKLLNTPNKHNAINRNILRALQNATIPEEFQGSILDVCFNLLNSAKEPVAVKAHSMTIIEKLAKIYPDIIPELKASVAPLMPNASPGLKNRGNKILGILIK